MQTLARDGHSDARIRQLLQADTLAVVAAGCELLTDDLQVAQDISDDLEDGQVERVMAATVHGTCRLRLTRALPWGTVLVRLYMVLTDDDITVRFNVGVYALTSPDRVTGADVETYDVTGYDRLYLLDRDVAGPYFIPAGFEYLAAVRQAVTSAGLSGVLLDGTAAGKLLPQDKIWPLIPTEGQPTTWLRIVNDLLEAIGYRGIWADQDGVLRSGPSVPPARRPAEYLFDERDPRTIVGPETTISNDFWAAPNSFVFTRRNLPGPTPDEAPPAPADGAGLYTLSVGRRGDNRTLMWTYREEIDAADQAAFIARADQIVAAKLRTSETLKVTTGPFPVAGHYDVFDYRPVDGKDRRVQSARSRFGLLGSDVEWDWETV